MKSARKKRSPLKGNPLRQAGQSVQDEINREHDFEFMHNAEMLIFGSAYIVLEWLRWFFKWELHPLATTLALLPFGIYLGYKCYKSYEKIQRLKQGRDGEKVIGEYLDLLRERGYKVFHDVTGDNFNVDHVLIGTTGVYAIETKTWSLPVGRKAIIKRIGEKLLVDGFEPDRNPVTQAKGSANWVSEVLAESTGKQYFVKPVVLFPGWFVEGKQDDVWVLNPKAFPKFLENERRKIVETDVTLASSHLSRFIRNS